MHDREQHREDLQHRVTALEARVVWLEEMLTRVLGEPANHAQAATQESGAPPIVPNPALDRFLLRTQPMPTLAWPVAATAPGSSATLDAAQDEITLEAGAEESPLEPWTLDLDSGTAGTARGAGLFTLDDGEEADAPEFSIDTTPQAAAVAARVAAPVVAAAIAPAAPARAANLAPAPASSRPTPPVTPPAAVVSLGITAAFDTLEATVAMAADAERAASKPRRRVAVPSIDLFPEMLAPTQAPPPPRQLDVCCALEMLNPSILQQIMAIWQLPECAARLHRLVHEDQNSRMGLDPVVLDELAMLGEVRKMLNAEAAQRA